MALPFSSLVPIHTCVFPSERTQLLLFCSAFHFHETFFLPFCHSFPPSASSQLVSLFPPSLLWQCTVVREASSSPVSFGLFRSVYTVESATSSCLKKRKKGRRVQLSGRRDQSSYTPGDQIDNNKASSFSLCVSCFLTYSRGLRLHLLLRRLTLCVSSCTACRK